jgi:hypothetical protein
LLLDFARTDAALMVAPRNSRTRRLLQLRREALRLELALSQPSPLAVGAL